MAFQVHQVVFLRSVLYYLLWGRIWLWDIPGVLVQRLFRRSSLPILHDVLRTAFRKFFNLAHYSQLRRFVGESDAIATQFLASKRFGPHKDQLYQKVVKDKFTGYWIVKGDVESAQDPADSDIVIYYLHGGGYVFLSVSNFLPFLLAIYESIKALKPNARISIFALEYDLAPEAHFPDQLRQAAAGYDYLVGDLGIDPKRIVLSGDSAGGHLSVSLLIHLRLPLPDVSSRITQKPVGLVLLTPWLDIFPSKLYVPKGASHRDVLDDPCGRYWANLFHPGTLSNSNDAEMAHLRPLECSLPWNEILPSKCTITTGTDDLLMEVCLELRDKAKLNGLNIDVEVEEGQAHDWEWSEVTNDLSYLVTSRTKTPEFKFKGAKQLAKIIANMVE